MKPVIVVTATHHRIDQIRLISRLATMLSKASKFVPITWLVVEDADKLSSTISTVLSMNRPNSMKTIHLFHGPTRQLGHAQKAFAIRYILERGLVGNVMFFDDDNFAHWKHFERVSRVEKAGVWRVNGVSIRGTEGPIVLDGKVVGFDGGFKSRTYAIDTAGFAVSSELLTAVTDDFLNTNQLHNWENNILTEMLSGRDDLETFDQACYISHNEMIGGEPENCWKADYQPSLFKIDWSHRGQPEVNSNVLGQFRTLAISKAYAKARLLEAIWHRFNENRYTQQHAGIKIDLEKIDLMSVSIHDNEDQEAWLK